MRAFHLRRRPRSENGQSTVEFALMLPVIMTFFFWAFEANIMMLGFHQMAYASYAAARSHVVERGQSQEQTVVNMILTGKIFTDAPGGPPRVMNGGHTTHRGNGWRGQPDGVRLQASGFDSLPYVRRFFAMNTIIPTHLGPDEFNTALYPGHGGRADPGTGKRRTDNNIEDF